ncbi:phage portal protein [Alloscardovia theropitheci]|uniref:Phage portal protein n=1 Tax=Alloscardovia theropitheci TaxID=2496842 RepID=A0A4R0QWS3_9BIFI|nr:phage portal protein [Alloscardovia theropitheci]TCD53761.1 phage portal protein [Alloscardovia theropitheci]
MSNTSDIEVWSKDEAYLDVASANLTTVQGLDAQYLPIVNSLLEVWRDHYGRNILRTRYYTAHEEFHDFGIGIPDRIRNKVQPMIAWPAKAVRSLADLSVFQGFETDDEDTYGIAQLVADNQLEVEMSQAITSAYIHSCAFLTVAADKTGKIRIVPRSADWSAAIWDNVERTVKAALTITDADKDGKITQFIVWLPGLVITISRTLNVWSVIDMQETKLDEVNVIPLAYDAQLNRPFGRSRISRTLMSLTNIGYRTMVRMESTAEFYSAPRLWFLGLDPDSFSADTWSSLQSSINAVSKDEDGESPTITQISQASMQPHSDMLRTVALLVAAETNLPVNDLGITVDNPASAEAMAAAERKLSREADRQNLRFGAAIKKAVIQAVRMRDGLTTIPDDLASIRPLWAPTKEVSNAALADAFSKLSAVIEGYSTSRVGLSRAGLTPEEITSLKTDLARKNARSILDSLTTEDTNANTSGFGTASESTEP